MLSTATADIVLEVARQRNEEKRQNKTKGLCMAYRSLSRWLIYESTSGHAILGHHGYGFFIENENHVSLVRFTRFRCTAPHIYYLEDVGGGSILVREIESSG